MEGGAVEMGEEVEEVEVEDVRMMVGIEGN